MVQECIRRTLAKANLCKTDCWRCNVVVYNWSEFVLGL